MMFVRIQRWYDCAALGHKLMGNSALIRSRSLHFIAQ